MAITNWIDTLCDLWQIDNGAGGTVRSYKSFSKNEFPETITIFPSCLTYPVVVSSRCSLGGVSTDIWRGKTEFHIAGDTSKKHFPAIMLFYALIRNAAAANMTLGGKVAWFALDSLEGNPSVEGPLVMTYGDEAPHLGLVANWLVKEIVTASTLRGDVTFDYFSSVVGEKAIGAI